MTAILQLKFLNYRTIKYAREKWKYRKKKQKMVVKFGTILGTNMLGCWHFLLKII